MRLDVALMDRGRPVLALDDDIGLAEALRHIADLEDKVIGDVGALAGVIVALAFVRIVPVVYALMLVGGMAWISLIASFNVAAHTAVPSWVRGRSLAVYMLAFQGGMAAGSAAWGVLADHTTIEWALVAAAIGLMVALLAALRYRLPVGEGPDLTPSMHWPSPIVADEPDSEHGPVLITVEYRVDAARSAEFMAALKELETTRRRDGAFRWGLYRDIAEPDRAMLAGKHARAAALQRYGVARFLDDWDTVLAEVTR